MRVSLSLMETSSRIPQGLFPQTGVRSSTLLVEGLPCRPVEYTPGGPMTDLTVCERLLRSLPGAKAHSILQTVDGNALERTTLHPKMTYSTPTASPSDLPPVIGRDTS